MSLFLNIVSVILTIMAFVSACLGNWEGVSDGLIFAALVLILSFQFKEAK